MNGLVLEAQASLDEAASANAIIVGSGIKTLELVADAALMKSLHLDPSRQLIGAQCSGTLVLAKLGLLNGIPACTDLATKQWVEEAGVAVLNKPFVASGNVATAGGCLASQYLSAWLISRLVGIEAAHSALQYVAPVGEKGEYVYVQCSRSLRSLHDEQLACGARQAHADFRQARAAIGGMTHRPQEWLERCNQK